MLEVKIIGDNPTDFLAKLAFVAEAFGVGATLPEPVARETTISQNAAEKLNGSSPAYVHSDEPAVETLNEQSVNDVKAAQEKSEVDHAARAAGVKSPAKAPAKVRAAAAPKAKPEPVAEVEAAEVIEPEPAEEKLTIEDIKGLARGVLGSHPDGIAAVRGAVAQITGTAGQVATVPTAKWPALAAALRARLEDITNV